MDIVVKEELYRVTDVDLHLVVGSYGEQLCLVGFHSRTGYQKSIARLQNYLKTNVVTGTNRTIERTLLLLNRYLGVLPQSSEEDGVVGGFSVQSSGGVGGGSYSCSQPFLRADDGCGFSLQSSGGVGGGSYSCSQPFLGADDGCGFSSQSSGGVGGGNESKTKCVEIPLLFCGTDFQKRVWKSLLAIPWGATISYQEVANRLGCPKSVRAVANAIGANPIAIVCPCHRVVGSNGTLTGYAGGLEIKRKLLDIEQ